ncbi:hypothetical protein [Aminobacter sp. AP02]|nr:hypothetical protein [Aminobacter sp. AP02]
MKRGCPSKHFRDYAPTLGYANDEIAALGREGQLPLSPIAVIVIQF